MFTPGLVSISFRELSPKEILDIMKKADLRHVEWGSDVHAPTDDPQRLQEIAALQKEYGISCCSYGTYFKLGKDDLSELSSYIAAAKILGTDILRLWCGVKGSADYTEEEKQSFFRLCKQAAAIAEEENVTFCMECHPKTMTDSLEAARELLEYVASPHFRMYWQPNQWKTEPENMAYATQMAPYTTHLHVFQWHKKEKFPLKNGEKVWKTYLTAFSGDHLLLLEFMPDNDPNTLPKEAETLREIIGEML